MTQQLLDGKVMPNDRSKAVNLEYDTEIALEGEEEKGLWIPWEGLAKCGSTSSLMTLIRLAGIDSEDYE